MQRENEFFYERCEITATNAAMYGFASWVMFTVLIFGLQGNFTLPGLIAAMIIATLPSNFVSFWVGLVLWNTPDMIIKECYDKYGEKDLKLKLLYT